MNLKVYFWIYLAAINLVSGVLFTYDKLSARHKGRRIKESTLHQLELLGGVYGILFLMYLIRHKNAKVKYYKWTWLTFVLWFFLILVIL